MDWIGNSVFCMRELVSHPQYQPGYQKNTEIS